MTQPIPFLALAPAYQELKPAIDEAVLRVLSKGTYILGEECERFEEEYAAFTQSKHAVGVANGLEAIVLGLRVLGIGPGDEVLVPANTFIATWLAVSAVGATPVGVEPDPRTWNIDAADAAARVTARTRAIIPVHLYGQPADLDAVHALAERYGLAVIEDAAQAHGARWGGRRIGGRSRLATWSFYPAKNLGAIGDGGAITTDDPDLAAKLRVLRNYGSRVRYHNEVRGSNSRLDEIQAAILRVKLRHLDAWNARRVAIASRYLTGLRGLALPQVHEQAEPVYHLFVVDHLERDALGRHLAERGVGTLVHYPVVPHRSEAYAELGLGEGSFPIAERGARTHLSLPIGPHLSDAEVAAVIEACNAFAGGSSA